MSLYIDKLFIKKISYRLERFTQNNERTWVFRCPFCGDSKKDKKKRRGYFYTRNEKISFKCQNCDASMPFWKFLKLQDSYLYDEYRIEKYKDEHPTFVVKNSYDDFKVVMKKVESKSISLPTIDDLPTTHSARQYIQKRKIPNHQWKNIHYTDDFKKFVDEILPGNDKKLLREDPRIILPFYDREKNLLGVQGRAMIEGRIRYITIKTDDQNEKIFGFDRLNFEKEVFVVEGPFDSLFINNCVATMDSSLHSILPVLKDCSLVTFIHDNQPRNEYVVKNIKKCVDLGHRVVLFPENVQGKDINEIVLSGVSQSELESMIADRTYSGLQAKLEFNKWRKV